MILWALTCCSINNSMSTLSTQFKEKLHKLLPTRGALVVGVSGGADSVALLYLLAQLVPAAATRLRVVHVHHGLRGKAADRDLSLVVRHSQKLNLQYQLYYSDVAKIAKKKGISVEAAGRLVRHDCFLDAARVSKARAVLLAHHQDDQIETFLLHLMRGAGPTGLSAMQANRAFPHPDAPQSLRLIRPLLEIPKRELEHFLRKYKIAWHQDQSNLNTTFTRNRIRHHLLPLLEKEYNPQIRTCLARSYEILAREDELLTKQTERALRKLGKLQQAKQIKINRTWFQRLPQAIQFRLLARVWESLCIPQKSAQHLNRLHKAIQGGHVGLSLPGVWFAWTRGETLHLAKRRPKGASPGFALPVRQGPGKNPKCLYGVESKSISVPKQVRKKNRRPTEILVDAKKWPSALQLRPYQSGDWMRPLGMGKSKKLIKKILSEMKLTNVQKKSWPLLAKGSEIIWVYRGPISERVKITATTKKALKIRIFPQTPEQGKKK